MPTLAWEKPGALHTELRARDTSIATSQRESLKRDTRRALDRAIAVLGSNENTIGHHENIRELDGGHLELTFYQLRHRWVGFARTSAELTAHGAHAGSQRTTDRRAFDQN